MFKNALVGVDGGANGRDAVALATQLLDPDGKLTLAHVHPGALHPIYAVTPGVLREEQQGSQKLLEQERSATGVEAQLRSVIAVTPGAGLHERAEEQHADLIVVGSCSRGAFGRVMLGDDTRAALNGASCAVAVAARGYAAQKQPLADVGVGYNNSPESEAALEAAKDVAAASDASVHALEVVAIPTYAFTGLMPPAIGESVDVLLTEATARMRALEGVDGRAVYGLTGEELASFGNGLDLLVVGSRGYGPVRRLVLGSTSDFLERNARCSLLVLPRGAAEAVEGVAAARQAVASVA
jgi:nucleotide-binding universal stress UspA family protein